MSDHLIRGLALGGRVRFVAAETTATTEELRRIHDPSPTVTAALGRLATGTLLMAASLEKVTGREPMLTIEVEGSGPAGRLVATASPEGWVRALVTNPLASAEPRADGSFDVPAVIGTSGHMVVTRDQGNGEPYRGVVPLRTGEIAQDLTRYLDDSEQLPSAIVLAVSVVKEGRVETAGGFMIQLLPGVSTSEADELSRRVLSLGPLTSSLEAGRSPADWMHHLFAGALEVLDEIPVRFLCGCSQDRVERALKLLGPNEIRAMHEASLEEPAQVTCEFCTAQYTLSRDRLAALLFELDQDIGTLH